MKQLIPKSNVSWNAIRKNTTLDVFCKKHDCDEEEENEEEISE